MQINLTINLDGLMDEDLELDEEGNPIPKKKRENAEDDEFDPASLSGLLSGFLSKCTPK